MFNNLRLSFAILLFHFFSFAPDIQADENKGYQVIEDQAKIPSLNPEFKDRKKVKIILENGLQAYLISDPETTQSAAVLTVLSGSYENPDELPGLAHFLEHMLFLGTEKYPKESEYQRYLGDHGGTANAFTAGDFTSFIFSVNNDGFEQALDRFASFFKTPLFNPSGVNRELNAIDQEYAQNLNNENWRELQVLKELSNPKHPFHEFDIGNSSTLSKATQADLRDWFSKHYSSNLMRLFIYSSLPIETLKDLTVQDFSEIPDRHLERVHYSEPLLREDLDGHIVYIEPNQNVRILTLVWELPPQIVRMHESKPDDIVCYVLGHEGKKSLLEKLKQEHLAEAISCGSVELAPDSGIFQIEIHLTAKGLSDVDTVIKRCFQAIHNMQSKPLPDYIFKDVQKISLLRYQYEPREDVFELAVKQGLMLPREELSTYPELTLTLKKADPAAVEELLSYLTPDRCQFSLAAPPEAIGAVFDKKEKWSGINYAVRAISEEKLKSYREASPIPEIDLPGPNLFIPQNLSLVPRDERPAQDFLSLPHPKALVDNSSMLGYFAKDYLYKSPKIYWRFTIKTPQLDNSKPQSVVMADLYIKALQDILDPISYDAKMAELDFTLERKIEGLQFTIEGYSDSAKKFLEEFVSKLTFKEISLEKFAVLKDSLTREYDNFSKDQPIKQAIDLLKGSVYESYTTNAKKAQAIAKIDLEKFKLFLNKLFVKTFTEALLIGNMEENEAHNTLNTFQKALASKPYPRSEQTPVKIVELANDKGPFFLQEKTEALGNAALLAIEGSKFSFADRNCQQMLGQAMQESFFSELRTKQQTGYIVYSSAEDLERHLFSFFSVQSNTHEATELLYRFEQFIEEYFQNITLAEIPKERFERLKDWLALELSDPPKNLMEMGEKLYQLAFNYKDFSWLSQRIEQLKKMNYEEFIHFADGFLGRSNRRRIAILINGNVSKENQFRYTPLSVSKLKLLNRFFKAA